jgi:hypothetical protein
MDKRLGQFMTPPDIARLIACELGTCDTVVDFAVGEGALLRAVQRRARKRVGVVGFDIDREMIDAANSYLDAPLLLRATDGLRARLPALAGRVGVIGNPPFLGPTYDGVAWVGRAFPRLTGKQGTDRAEVQFLARSLVTARSTGGRVVLVMPIGFADGDVYRRIRTQLMEQYHVVRCIEVAAGAFVDTEARTVVLVIDTSQSGARGTEICEIAGGDVVPRVIVSTSLVAGCRLDARYHKAMLLGMKAGPVLKDLRVCIERGVFSRKEAEERNIQALHTSHLGSVIGQKLIAFGGRRVEREVGMVTARKGDILLSRTGSRVSWEPVIVHSGDAPITDHLFRIRAPRAVRELVHRSFCHPSFSAWLNGASKGVCATVLTKRDLLEMPVFAFVQMA